MSDAVDSSMEKKKGPIHVLMTSAVSPQQEQMLLDPRLQSDYVTKRENAYLRSIKSKKSKQGLKSVWDGVSRVEKEMVSCCEKIELDDDDEEDSLSGGGALDVDKEVRFAGILARDCHTMATKCLALAILERTMQTYLEEDQEEDSESQDEESEDEEDKKVPSDDAEDGDWKPGSKRLRSSNGENEEKQKKQKVEEEDKVVDHDEDDDEGEMRVGRLERFLAAGGLKVLNRWLIDASIEEPVVALKKPPGSRKEPEELKTKPPSTRPLILPMLRFLEHIPFDKKVVLDAKINKQIRRLGKQVDAIRKEREHNTAESVDLENWSSEPTTDEKDALDEVVQAVQNVKSSWERMAREYPRKFEDPFDFLKAKLMDRLAVLVQFEGGVIPKPDWFDDTEPEKERKKPPKSKKLNTKELAARERQSEREDLKQKLRAAQDEHRERLAQLRQKFQKRKEDVAPAAKLKKGGSKKSVVWKDGLRTQINRNRKMLEEVFMFEKDTPASKDVMDEVENDSNVVVKSEEQDVNGDAEQPSNLKKEEP
jgi:hypothetical protein